MIGDHARLLGLGRALPPHRVSQHAVADAIHGHFREQREQIDRLRPAFTNTTVEQRYLARPLAWLVGRRGGFVEANEAYVETALDLAEASSREALDHAGRSPEDVDAVILVSSTGLSTPSLDSILARRLGLSPHVRRVPLWGLGCAGGVSGLARAREIAAALEADRVVLCVAVELCSLTFQRDDASNANLIATSLFGDGAAAAVVGRGIGGPALLDPFSVLFPDTEDIMGWDVVPGGLKVRFSRDIPAFLAEHGREAFDSAARAWGIERGTLRHVVSHPGGPKVMRALTECLDLDPGALDTAAATLRRYGNMSSPTVLFVLREFLATTPPDGREGTLFALGPGFCAEFLRFRHDGDLRC